MPAVTIDRSSLQDEAWNIPLCLPPRVAFLDGGEVPEEARGMDDEAHRMHDDALPSSGGRSEDSEDVAGGSCSSKSATQALGVSGISRRDSFHDDFCRCLRLQDMRDEATGTRMEIRVVTEEMAIQQV